MLKLVMVAHPELVRAMRSGGPVTTRSFHGEEFSDVAKPDEVTSHNVGCKACGCPMVKGTPILSARTFDSRAKLQRSPSNVVQIHAHDCWARGAIQCVKLDGNGGFMRYVEPTHGLLLDEKLSAPFLRQYDPSWPPTIIGSKSYGRVFIDEDTHEKLYHAQKLAADDRWRARKRPYHPDPYNPGYAMNGEPIKKGRSA